MRVNFTVKVGVRVIQVAILYCKCEATHHVVKLNVWPLSCFKPNHGKARRPGFINSHTPRPTTVYSSIIRQRDFVTSLFGPCTKPR